MPDMKVLVACEFSGIVRDAFIALGHDAWSCDLLTTERPGPHFQCDVRDILAQHWDMMIAHPPCTHLCSSGARWWITKAKEQEAALEFVHRLLSAPIPSIALENPVGIIGTAIRKPDQIIQPWQFGHGETKATCLWLKNLPILQPTHRRDDLFCSPEPLSREHRIHRLSPSPNRWKERSRTFPGIASATAQQWGNQPVLA